MLVVALVFQLVVPMPIQLVVVVLLVEAVVLVGLLVNQEVVSLKEVTVDLLVFLEYVVYTGTSYDVVVDLLVFLNASHVVV